MHPDRVGTSAQLPAQLAPYSGFTQAAQAVFASFTDDTVERDMLLGRLLSTILAVERRSEGNSISAGGRDPMLDPETGLCNDRGWVEALAAEEDRCRRHDMAATVISVSLDSTTSASRLSSEEAVAVAAARRILTETRAHDVIARVTPNEFAVLATHCTWANTEPLASRMAEALADDGIKASVGAAPRDKTGLARAWEEARRRAAVQGSRAAVLQIGEAQASSRRPSRTIPSSAQEPRSG